MAPSMTPQELRGRFGGVIAFPVTPFRADLSLDLEGLRKNLAHLAKFPFCAVVAGVGFNQALAVELARQSAAAGASGILALPPYFPGAPDDGMLEYYKAIGAATPLGMLVHSRAW